MHSNAAVSRPAAIHTFFKRAGKASNARRINTTSASGLNLHGLLDPRRAITSVWIVSRSGGAGMAAGAMDSTMAKPPFDHCGKADIRRGPAVSNATTPILQRGACRKLSGSALCRPYPTAQLRTARGGAPLRLAEHPQSGRAVLRRNCRWEARRNWFATEGQTPEYALRIGTARTGFDTNVLKQHGRARGRFGLYEMTIVRQNPQFKARKPAPFLQRLCGRAKWTVESWPAIVYTQMLNDHAGSNAIFDL